MSSAKNDIETSTCDNALFLHHIKEELKRCQKQCQVVSIFTGSEDLGKFTAGFVRAVDNDYVLIAHITPFGAYDGYRVEELEAVRKVKYDGKYEHMLQRLYEIQKQSHPDVAITGSLISDLLIYAKKHTLLISAELLDSDDDDVQGLVLGIKDDILTIRQVDRFGDEDGTCIVDIRDITVLVCDSDVEAALRLLIKK